MITSASGNKFNGLLGTAGEHFIMSKLLLMNLVACLAPTGAPGVDIVVSDAFGDKQCAIQVKSQRLKGKARPAGWTMNKKSEQCTSSSFFYCFVSFFENGESPISYIVPSAVVSTFITKSHKRWLETPGKQGQAHNDSKMRKFQLFPEPFEFEGKRYASGWADEYLENWNLLSNFFAETPTNTGL